MMFRSISENKFIGTSDGNIISWCPTMDLLTITMNRMSLWVFRINGERVYSVNNRSPITEISWKPDGRSFALMGIDGICKIYDSNSGKLINTIEPGPGRLKLNITQTIQWSDTKTRTARNSSSRSTSKFSGIFDIDISTQLPVLPTPHAYTSKVMVDDMNQQGSDLLMIVDSCKSLSLTFHNIFTTDSIDMPKEGIKKYLKLASYSLDKLFFLVKTDVPLSMSTEVSLIEMNLNLVRSFQMEIILQCSKILAILEYMEETFEAIKPDLSSFLDNLDRHLSNFKDCLYEDVDLTTCFPTLQEAEDKMSVALYDILVTNLIPEEQRDYWLNQFGERGLKKLQSLGQAAYALIRKIGFSQIISALERLIVILGRLEGISKWLDSENSKADSNNFGLSTEGISRSIEFASVLLKRTYEFIWEINEELKLFNFFMEWLKNVIIERLAKEDDILSVTSEVGNEKYLTLSGYKNSDLMKFVDGHLFSTRILKYINLEKDYEVVRSSLEETCHLSTIFESLSTTLKTSLLPEVRKVIKSNIQFRDAIPLPISGVEDGSYRFKIIQDIGYILCKTNISQITVVRFSIIDPGSIIKVVINTTHEKVLKFEILTNELVILSRGDIDDISYRLTSYNISSLDNFANGSVIESSQLQIIKSKTYSIDEEFIPKYLSINEKIGCLLDENKQSYKIFAT